MTFLKSLDISGSALRTQKTRMDVTAQNIANASTTRTESGDSYRRKIVVLEENNFEDALNNANLNPSGVKVSAINEDMSPLKPVYNPSHPDADESGYVYLPNVDTVTEMVEMISATRSYEASATAFNALKQMAAKALEIGK